MSWHGLLGVGPSACYFFSRASLRTSKNSELAFPIRKYSYHDYCTIHLEILSCSSSVALFPKRLARLEGLYLFHSVSLLAVAMAHSMLRLGTSPNMEDGVGSTHFSKTRFISRSSFMESIFPSQVHLRSLIHSRTGEVGSDASSAMDLPLIFASIFDTVPFNFFLTSSVSSHASHPWISVEATAERQSRSLRFLGRRVSVSTRKRFENVVLAISARCSTGVSGSPSPESITPRYLNSSALDKVSFPIETFPISSCSPVNFFFRTSYLPRCLFVKEGRA